MGNSFAWESPSRGADPSPLMTEETQTTRLGEMLNAGCLTGLKLTEKKPQLEKS